MGAPLPNTGSRRRCHWHGRAIFAEARRREAMFRGHPPATSGPPPTIRHPAWIGGGTQHTTAALTPVDRRRIQDR